MFYNCHGNCSQGGDIMCTVTVQINASSDQVIFKCKSYILNLNYLKASKSWFVK